MKLYLNTSQPTTILEIDDHHYEWEDHHTLARDLLKIMHNHMQENGFDWQDISEIHFFAGPGSFTGLRIGATIVNTLADQLKVPLYNQRGEQVELILPEYGREANITPPKK